MAKAKHPHDSTRPEPRAVKRALAKGDMEALGLALTVRQRRFAEEYSIDFQGKAAAIRAGYSTNQPEKQAYLLLQHKGVLAYIDHLTRSKQAKIVSVNPDYVLQKITNIVNNDEAKDSDKLRGLELLARHLGMLTDKTEITGRDGGPIELEQRIQEEAESMKVMLEALRRRSEKKDVVIV